MGQSPFQKNLSTYSRNTLWGEPGVWDLPHWFLKWCFTQGSKLLLLRASRVETIVCITLSLDFMLPHCLSVHQCIQASDRCEALINAIITCHETNTAWNTLYIFSGRLNKALEPLCCLLEKKELSLPPLWWAGIASAHWLARTCSKGTNCLGRWKVIQWGSYNHLKAYYIISSWSSNWLAITTVLFWLKRSAAFQESVTYLFAIMDHKCFLRSWEMRKWHAVMARQSSHLRSSHIQ